MRPNSPSWPSKLYRALYIGFSGPGGGAARAGGGGGGGATLLIALGLAAGVEATAAGPLNLAVGAGTDFPGNA